MKTIFIVKILKALLQNLLKRTTAPKLFRQGVVILFAASLALALGVQGYAGIPDAAVIKGFNGSGEHFWIRRTANSRKELITEIPNIDSGNGRINRQGELSVPTDGEASASLYFVGRENYDGLVVQTRPMPSDDRTSSRYTFPCRFQGAYIIAWRANSQSRSCDPESGGIQIVTDPGKVLSYLKNSSEVLVGFKNKQNSSQGSIERLTIDPGQEQTVIRTSVDGTTSVVEYIEKCVVVRTEPKSPSITSGPQRIVPGDSTSRCSKEPKNTTSDVVSIEVLEGTIIAKSKEKPEGEVVKKGQKYSYPERVFSPIDANSEANSCKMLRFLNAAYWSSPATPKSISDGIAEQLKQHREALGVSGRPPDNLSELERDIFVEMNSVRNNPAAYADLLEKQKQFFRSNYLTLPAEPFDFNKRGSAVDKTISFLRSQKPLPPFSISRGMSGANQDHVTSQGKSGKSFGHAGDDSIGTGERLKRHGSVGCPRYDEDEYENIIYFEPSDRGAVSKSQALVMEMLIDYRPRRTGNQDNLFNRDFQVVGVACGSHSNFLHEMCVVTYAEGYLEKS
ncbi:MAG: hypothetical protein KME43_18260 [Myxacorys chilensis ATA2-1-KO14]|jgi:uncharacterized protein YkwD|nr:hypothetical protein [Myxacorys chilensis ATA2-1-KO14]